MLTALGPGTSFILNDETEVSHASGASALGVPQPSQKLSFLPSWWIVQSVKHISSLSVQ